MTRLFAILLAACLASFVTAACVLVWLAVWPSARPASPLTAGLSGAWSSINDEFDRRVRAAFPIGLPVAQIGATLKGQGFVPLAWGAPAEQERRAVRREDNWVCRKAAYVIWRADADDRLTEIRGAYREEGCL